MMEMETDIDVGQMNTEIREHIQNQSQQIADPREYLPDALIEIDFTTRNITFMSRMARILFGYDKDALNVSLNASQLFASNAEFQRAVEKVKEYALESIQTEKPYHRTGRQELVEFQMKTRDGRVFPVESQGSFILDARGIPYAVQIVIRDITRRKELEAEREQLVANLEKALEKVKTLQGLIPICSSCNKIRDDDGYWRRLEEYIEAHSNAEFSHGICPDCMKKLYPKVSKRTK